MARFFQHVENNDNQGKVTRLMYIDDISDDEMTLYYFADGTYCNSEYIGKYDINDVIKANCVMVELTSPTNKWKFEKHVVLPEESPMMIADDGTLCEAVLPGAQVQGSGQNGEVTSDQKSGTRIDIKPPKIPNAYKPEDDEHYLLSIHPELENTSNDSSSASVRTEVSDMSSVFKALNVETNNSVSDIAKTVENAPKKQDVLSVKDISFDNLNTFINVDALVQSNNIIDIEVNGKRESISPSELVKRLSISSEQYEKVKASKTNNSLLEEDVLIKNMIEKSKRKKCAITMRVNYELPPKEVYDTIKSVYEEGLAEQFVKGLALRMPYDKLIASFAAGLAGYYDNTLTNKNNTSTKTIEQEVL